MKPTDIGVAAICVVVAAFGIARVILMPSRPASVPESSQFSSAFFQAMEIARSKERCAHHCNQWFTKDGTIESVTPDGNWIASRQQDGRIVYTAARTGLLEYDGGYVFIYAGRSKIEVMEGTDVTVAGVNIRLGIADERGAMIWFGRSGPVGTDYIGIGE